MLQLLNGETKADDEFESKNSSEANEEKTMKIKDEQTTETAVENQSSTNDNEDKNKKKVK